MSIYLDCHSERLSAKPGESGGLLGGTSQFCASFFHIEPTPEADIPELCLCKDAGVCPRKTVVGVARLQRPIGAVSGDEAAWTDVYCARYSNCFQGGSELNLHAEKFLLADEGLRAAIASLPSAESNGARGRLLFYLTYQPCHHSGGHKARGMGEHGTSCTELLLRYVEGELAPAAVTLSLRLAYIYRAHWTDGFHPKYAPAVQAARRGLELLASRAPHIELDALTSDDWEWLVSVSDASVRTAWRERAAPFSDEVRQARARLDAFVATVLATFTTATGALPSPAGIDPSPLAVGVDAPAADYAQPPADAVTGALELVEAEVICAEVGVARLAFCVDICEESAEETSVRGGGSAGT